MYKEHFANLSKLQKIKNSRKFVNIQCRSPFNLTIFFGPKYFEILISISMTLTMRLFLDFMRPEIVKDSCLDAHSRILVLFQKGTKVTDDRYFGQGRVLLTKLKRRLVLG